MVDNSSSQQQIQNCHLEALKNWCGLNKIKVIFDSDIDGDGSGTLAKSIKGLGNLYFITFDDNNNVFGGFLSSMVKLKQEVVGLQIPEVTDTNCFLFSLIRNGSTHLKKWPIDQYNARYAFSFNYHNVPNKELYAFGNTFKTYPIGKDSNYKACTFFLGRGPIVSDKCHIQRILVLKMRW
ncbi:TLDc domain-containing protein [Entamoeba marina]